MFCPLLVIACSCHALVIYRDSLKFFYYARGSLFESKHWIYLLYKRNMADAPSFRKLLVLLESEGVKLNNFINTLKRKSGSDDK
jgi:four helix bundle protein